MSTKVQTKVQANTTQTFTPVLQKPRPLSDSPHLILQRRDHHEPNMQELGKPVHGTPAFIDPRFGHDFSRIRIFNEGAGRNLPIQAKLRINKPGDVYEEEADRVADVVMRMEEPGVQRQVEDEEEETLQAKPLAEEITPLVQRQVEPEELQVKATSDRVSEVNSNLESHIQSFKGGGQRLSENNRAFFEPRFGHDFSRVRVHTDAKAAEAARAVNARAFTLGQDVVFSMGHYQPNTHVGRQLLAHELVHVVQQGSRHELIQRGSRIIKLTEKEKFEWDVGILHAEIDRFDKLSTKERLAMMELILQALRRISVYQRFADVDPKVQREITIHITTIESMLSAFAKAQRENVKTYEESNFSWAAIGGIAMMDGPQPGPADVIALIVMLGRLLLVGAIVTTMTLDPDLTRRQAEALRDTLKDVSESLARVKPAPVPETSSKPESKPGQRTIDIAPPIPEEWDRRNECQRKNPFALYCEDPRKMDMEEVVIEYLMNEGYSFEDIGICRFKSRFESGEIKDCTDAPGERWHCRVKGTTDEISVFGCLCCHTDGSPGSEWHAHWSDNLSKR